MTRRQRREADSDFHSSAQLIRRRDIARYSGSTTARLCVNFSAIFIGNWRCSIVKVALRRTCAQILTRLGIVECAAATRKFLRDFYSAIFVGARSDESHDFIR